MSRLYKTVKLQVSKILNIRFTDYFPKLDCRIERSNSKSKPSSNKYRGVVVNNLGFTLIEVLLALAIIAIALTALLKGTAQNIENTKRLKDKNTSHWIAMQAVNMIQLNLVHLDQTQESTQVTTMLGEKWYWRAKLTKTPISRIQKINISISKKDTGPFLNELTAFRYLL